jgi:hypothetical protein
LDSARQVRLPHLRGVILAKSLNAADAPVRANVHQNISPKIFPPEENAVALIELIGQETGSQTVRIERGPVKVFAQALLDGDPIYDSGSAPVPPTYPFVMHFWGAIDQEGTPGLPIERLRGAGRAILHGEQGFTYTRWPRVGDVLKGTTTITDVYEKTKSNGGSLEFYVTETDWRDLESDEPVVKSTFTLVVNVRPPKN